MTWGSLLVLATGALAGRLQGSRRPSGTSRSVARSTTIGRLRVAGARTLCVPRTVTSLRNSALHLMRPGLIADQACQRQGGACR